MSDSDYYVTFEMSLYLLASVNEIFMIFLKWLRFRHLGIPFALIIQTLVNGGLGADEDKFAVLQFVNTSGFRTTRCFSNESLDFWPEMVTP
jgi:hypothetical protein